MFLAKQLVLALSLPLAILFSGASPVDGGPRVAIKNGTLRGVALDSYSQEAFLGVRFAQPPVGELRLRPARSLNSTFKEEDATAYSPFCPGFGSDDDGYTLDEDCLTLNVIRPKGIISGSNVPVGTFFYGGSYSQGGSGDVRYNGTWIVKRSVAMGKPIIFVSINYRVGAGGFLYSSQVADEGSQNLGVRDQRLALEWIHENIHSFGGDPKKVTIWGESAGAMSVSVQLLAYNLTSTPLFRAAIMESGAPTTANFPSVADRQAYYDSIVNDTGCANASDALDCLRALSFAEWNRAVNVTSTAGIWSPVIDGQIIPSRPTTQLANHAFVHVPLLIGANTDEGTAFGVTGIDNDTALRQSLASHHPELTSHSLDAILALYPNDPLVGCPYSTGDGILASGLQDKRSLSITGDVTMHGPRRLMARSTATTAPVFSYRFNQVPQNMSMAYGVTHFQEIPYVFSNPLQTTVPLGNRAGDRELAQLMTSYWISFIHDLDPNDSKVGDAPTWPNYAKDAVNLVFNRHGSYVEKDDYRLEGIDFINQLGAELKH